VLEEGRGVFGRWFTSPELVLKGVEGEIDISVKLLL
jgi:hypothetical protein